jgi:YVTN family beta-propeller protein
MFAKPEHAQDKRGHGTLFLLPWAIVVLAMAATVQAETDRSNVDRSPIDVAVHRDGRWLVTANETSNTLSVVDLDRRKVVQEIACGRRPAAVVFSADQRRLLATAAYSGELHVFDFDAGSLKPVQTVRLGFEPRGMALTRDGRTAYVCLAGAGSVAVVDLADGRVTAQIEAGRWPRSCALSPDESRLAVAASGNLGVSVIDPHERKLLYQESVGGLNLGLIQTSANGLYAYVPWMVYRQNAITPANIRKGWVLGSRIGRVRLDGSARREAITLDPPGMAVSDPYGLTLSPDEQTLVATGSGTHELLVYKMSALEFESFGGPGDHIERNLLEDRANFYRLDLGGRPMAVRFLPKSRRVAVANYLSNAVQIIDLDAGEMSFAVYLGGPSSPSLARTGEAIFYDGRRSLDQWYSCHSCHYEGGPNAVTMDTRNDGSEKTFKTVPSLVNVAHTGPWTWHGWQVDLHDAMRKSLTETMLGPPPRPADSDALLAFLETLEPAPNPYRDGDRSADFAAAVQRGEKLFASKKAACIECHRGPYFTDGEIHDVGLGSPRDAYQGYNTPSLVGVHARVKLLHDGRAKSLEALLTGPHAPDKVAGEAALSGDELHDLIEYLKTL